MQLIVSNTCAAFGAQSVLTIEESYPVVFNHAEQTDFIKVSAAPRARSCAQLTDAVVQ
jgi:metal-dependent amidase/aminoacylase/carboxypeptidase family protein